MMHALLNAWLRGPDHPAKLRLFRWFVKRLPNSQVHLRMNDSTLAVSIDDFIGSRIIFDGGYENRTLERAQSLMRDGGLFIDVGSNFGLYSILLSANERVRVIAIEPDEYNFLQLKVNTLNNGRSNIILCNTALSNREAVLPFELPCIGNLGSVRIAPRNGRTANSNIVYRSATTFHHLAGALNVDEIALMKIDVEGHELAVLQGIDWSAKYKPRNIICEFLDRAEEQDGGPTRHDIYDFLISKGYEGLDVEGNLINRTSDAIECNAWFRLI
jgi:FkbM family methyltransferase